MHQNWFIIKKSTIRLTLLLVLFKIALDLSYIYVVSPIYDYSGFTISIKPLAVFESYLFVILIGLSIPPIISRASHFFIWMLAIGAIIPNLSFYAMHSGSRIYMNAILLSFLCVVLVSKLPIAKIGTLKEGRTIGIIILILMVFSVTFSLITKGGLSYFNLDLRKVYDYRSAVGEIIDTGLWAYINTWVFKVINPALIAWALWRKKYQLVVAFIALQILFFAISSHKAVLFYPVLIIVVYYVFKQKRVSEYLSWGLISVVIISSIFSLFLDYNWLSALFTRRVFFIPAQLNFVYYDLFSSIGHVYLSNSVLSNLIAYPFDYPPPQMVSMYLYGHIDSWPNDGFLATGYMHFGYVGMLVFSIIVGMLLWTLDTLVNKRIPLWLGISILIVPFYSLFTSADLFTAMLTHGILLGLIIVFVMANRQGPL
ncbi:MAG: hypothetical protein ABFD18_12635 [Syntrophomonas sp.]